MASINYQVQNQKVIDALKNGNELIIRQAEKGLLRAGLYAEARAKALAPVDKFNLVNSIHSDDKVTRGGDYIRLDVGVNANQGDVATYAKKVHENMEYDGPNVGGSNTQKRGPGTRQKGVSSVEPSDGSAGGKYIERAMRNKPQRYAKIVQRVLAELLK